MKFGNAKSINNAASFGFVHIGAMNAFTVIAAECDITLWHARQALRLLRNTGARFHSYFCRGKVIGYIYVYEYVYLLLPNLFSLQNPIFSVSYYMAIYGLSGCTYFFTLSHKREDFLKQVLNITRMFWFFLQLLSEALQILE